MRKFVQLCFAYFILGIFVLHNVFGVGLSPNNANTINFQLKLVLQLVSIVSSKTAWKICMSQETWIVVKSDIFITHKE